MSIPYGKIVDQNNLLSIDIHVLTDKIRLNTRKQKKDGCCIHQFVFPQGNNINRNWLKIVLIPR